MIFWAVHLSNKSEVRSMMRMPLFVEKEIKDDN